MKKTLLFATVIAFIASACSKRIEDRLVGSWKLISSYKQRTFDRDHFSTGYEAGTFTFNENGTAVYTSSTDTLTGYWNADHYTVNTGSDTKSLRHLKIELVNFLQNRLLFWEFDDFNFRNTWKTIRAEEYTLNYTRVYEFTKQ
jgi:hypothetical protein